MASWMKIAAAVGVMIGLSVWTAGCSSTNAGRSAEPVKQTEAPETVKKVETPEPVKPVEAPADSVVMALKFVPGQTTTYKLDSKTERRVDYIGNVPAMPDELKPGRTGSELHMTFDQQVESVEAGGDAILKITIKSLAYIVRSKDAVPLDFDSSRPGNAQMPLAKLIGQSYTLRMSPGGVVLAITDAQAARAAAAGNLPGNQTAQRLISDEVIKERHAVTALAAAQKKTVREGDTWAYIKVVPFGVMGTDTLQQNYKLASIEKAPGRRVAVVEMEAIPSAAMAQQLHRQVDKSVDPGMMDSTEKDAGRLRLDLTQQRIDEYTEDLTKEWVTVLPEKRPNAGGFVGMKMGVVQQYHLERVE